MTYQFGKAITAGRRLSDDEVRALEADRLQTLWRQLKGPERTDDPLDRRLAEELAYASRLLAVTEAELRKRGLATAGERVHEADTVIGDVAAVVEAKDRCEGVERVSPAVKRRLLRDAPAEGGALCARARGPR